MNVPMVYVNPLTGPYAGRRWFCYVCALGSAPVLAVFIKPEVVQDTRAMEAVQHLVAKRGGRLRSFVVVLSGPDPKVKRLLLRRAEQEKITVPLTVLPERAAVGAIHKTLPIPRDATVTGLLYGGRRIVEVLPARYFEGNDADRVGPSAEHSHELRELPATLVTDFRPFALTSGGPHTSWIAERATAHGMAIPGGTRLPVADLESLPSFREMDDAVARMLLHHHADG